MSIKRAVDREPHLGLGLASMSSVVSALSLIPAVTQAQDPPAEATLETTTASHSRAPRASRPSQSTSIIRHLVQGVFPDPGVECTSPASLAGRWIP